jgi:hypothetical protein
MNKDKKQRLMKKRSAWRSSSARTGSKWRKPEFTRPLFSLRNAHMNLSKEKNNLNSYRKMAIGIEGKEETGAAFLTCGEHRF